MTAGNTAPERAASQRELDQLRARVDMIDVQGTRGVGVLQTQVMELIKDLAELRAQAGSWQERHDSQHAADTRERVIGRRWVVGTCIAIVVMLTAVLTLTLQASGGAP